MKQKMRCVDILFTPSTESLFFHMDLQLDLKCHKLVLFSGLSVSLLVVSQSLC